MEESLEGIRHSLAHLLAAAVLKRYPDAKPTIGPAIENGFYYDFDFTESPSVDDLPTIEAEMKKILKGWRTVESRKVSSDEARTIFADNRYKLELIDDIVSRGEDITLYTWGDFQDLCRGGHVVDAQKIDPESFKLVKVAGAYWRGDEKNPMLTRIYGLAFATKEELDAHLIMLEEAEKRDHRKLGKELDLFTFSDLVGPGLPLWTARGTLLRNLLDDYIWQLRKKRGYEQVTIPHITKRALYETSGHWEKFQNDLFKVSTREEHEFAMKPMNCPHHTQIFARKPHSYRDMPQRYAETTMVYRDEQSGELHGLSRVLCITQDDAHVFCRGSQIKEEALKIWDIIDTFYTTVGFGALRARLSLHNPAEMEKYLGSEDMWLTIEEELRALTRERGATVVEAIGEAAFYGPKIDFIAKDSIGREWQVATIQLDFNMPERFDLCCTNEQGERERIFMIHAAIMGSIERFLSIYIEHCAGVFPLWLSPVQVAILSVGEAHHEASAKLAGQLKEQGIRAEVDESSETVGKKIRNAEKMKIPYMLVIGDKENDLTVLSVRKRGSKDTVEHATNEFITTVRNLIQERSHEL
ncbi:threonine--tRNA ligase [Candidatus Uhrbacteria bacterium]|nr:threonine--tRNA ligase [Candidatus Uhrbacteria bacterium]